MRHSTRLFVVLAGTAVAFACGDLSVDSGTPLDPDQDGRITVNNDAASLNQRVTRRNAVLGIAPVSVPYEAGAAARAQHNVTLVLKAEVDAPAVDGNIIQATHVHVQGNRAYVSYNTQGPAFRGGAEILNTSDLDDVTIQSQLLFNDTDVSALTWFGGDLYLATATADPAFVTPAVLEVIHTSGGVLTTDNDRVGVPSYVATGVAVLGNHVFVTSGTGGNVPGGLTTVNRNNLGNVAYAHAFHDARGVDVSGNQVVTVSGTPGMVRVHDRVSGAEQLSIDAGGANVPESKSTVVVRQGRIFMSAGDEGLKVFDAATGDALASMAVPVPSGVDPAMAVTNAVSVAGDLIFMANGGAGLHVVQADKDLDNDQSSGLTLAMVGQIQFDVGTSVNFVASRGNTLFVATGTGGFKVIEIM